MATDMIDFVEAQRAEGMNVVIRILRGVHKCFQVIAQAPDFKVKKASDGILEQSGTLLKAKFTMKGELIKGKKDNEPKVIASFEV